MRRIIKNIADANIRRELEAIWERLNLIETKTVEPTTANLAPGAMAVYDGVLYVNDRQTIRKVTADTEDAAYLKADGSVALTGNMLVNSGVTVDGVDISGHHARHESGGADAIKLDDLSAPDDNTDLNASTSAHGLLPKLDDSAAHFLDGKGAWSTPPVTSPGGSDTQVQFNDGGSLGGDDKLIWNKTNNNLGIGTSPQSWFHLHIQESNVSTVLGYRGISNVHVKTTGISNPSSPIHGIYNETGILHSGKTHKDLYGIENYTYLLAGGISGSLYGIKTECEVYTGLAISGNVYGLYVTIDNDGNVSGDVYGIFVEQESGVDYSLYLKGDPIIIVLHNETHQDTDGGRDSQIDFRGEQSGGEITTLARILAQHDGASDDEKGELIFYTNDGSDDDSPTERMRIDSAGVVTIEGDLDHDGTNLGFYGVTPVAQAAHFTGMSSYNVTDPADAPADADALRDDLVTNTIPAIEAHLQTIMNTMNSIITVLENVGLMANA